MYRVNTLGSIGDFVLPNLLPPAAPPQGAAIPSLDAASRAQLIAQAPNATDEQAQFFVDFTDATHLGGRTRVMRYAVGAGVGVGVGALLGWLLGRRK